MNTTKSPWETGLELLKKADYTSAIQNFKSALDSFYAQNNQLGIASCLLAIGISFTALNKFDDAKAYFEKGLSIVSSISFKPGIASYLMNRGLLSQKMKKYAEALDDFNASLTIFTEINESESAANLRAFINNCKEEQANQGKSESNTFDALRDD